jgi:large subunit ribosomal protein L15e
MGMYKYVRNLWRSENYKEIQQSRLISWRREPVFVKIERPTRLDRARRLGYKAKQGFVLVRARIGKGSSKRETPSGGRKPLRAGRTKYTPTQSLQHIAEARVAKRHPNLEVLNSYYVAEDGKHKWFEVILVDVNHPCIKNDQKLNWICKSHNKDRAFRGLTASGKRSRMLGKGKGYERKNTNKR